MEQIGLATPEWVWWWNNQRHHSELAQRTPIEAEQAHYAKTESLLEATVSQRNARNENQGDSEPV